MPVVMIIKYLYSLLWYLQWIIMSSIRYSLYTHDTDDQWPHNFRNTMSIHLIPIIHALIIHITLLWQITDVHTEMLGVKEQLICAWIFPWHQVMMASPNIIFTYCYSMTFGMSEYTGQHNCPNMISRTAWVRNKG